MFQLSGLRMRNFSDLMCLPKSREEKVTESNEGKDKLDPSLHGFQHGSGLKADNTLSATRLS